MRAPASEPGGRPSRAIRGRPRHPSIRNTFRGAKKASGDRTPASTSKKAVVRSGRGDGLEQGPAAAARAVGGQVEGEPVHRQAPLVAPRLVARQGGRTAARADDGRRQALGVLQGVPHALTRGRVHDEAGVAGQPASGERRRRWRVTSPPHRGHSRARGLAVLRGGDRHTHPCRAPGGRSPSSRARVAVGCPAASPPDGATTARGIPRRWVPCPHPGRARSAVRDTLHFAGCHGERGRRSTPHREDAGGQRDPLGAGGDPAEHDRCRQGHRLCHAECKPRPSARTAACSITSGRCSNGVNPMPTTPLDVGSTFTGGGHPLRLGLPPTVRVPIALAAVTDAGSGWPARTPTVGCRSSCRRRPSMPVVTS